MIVKAQDFTLFLKKCQADNLGDFRQVIVPRRSDIPENGDLFFEEMNENTRPVLDSYRTVDPLRSLFYFSRETLLPADTGQKRLIIGAKACDMAALQILDKALINEDFVDSVYQSWRKQTTIVTSDCNEICSSCHCNLVGGKPYTDQNYDMNIARVGQDYLITIGSKKGEELVKLIKATIPHEQPRGDEKEKIKNARKAVETKLKQQNEKYARPDDYSALRKSDIEGWIKASRECVGCGGCTNICPTCYCIILNDETTGAEFVKVRSQDSCQLHGYARVAGGDSPRHKMYQRFRNRYLCKFDYMLSNFGQIGCTGCGRCIDVCAAEIEFREVVQKNMQLPVGQE